MKTLPRFGLLFGITLVLLLLGRTVLLPPSTVAAPLASDFYVNPAGNDANACRTVGAA